MFGLIEFRGDAPQKGGRTIWTDVSNDKLNALSYLDNQKYHEDKKTLCFEDFTRKLSDESCFSLF